MWAALCRSTRETNNKEDLDETEELLQSDIKSPFKLRCEKEKKRGKPQLLNKTSEQRKDFIDDHFSKTQKQLGTFTMTYKENI